MGIRRSLSTRWKQAGYPLILFILACYLTIGLPLAQAQLSMPRAVAQQQDESEALTTEALITEALTTGQTLYQAGRFHEAAQIWQKAAARYEAQGDRLHQAIALSYLSLAQQRLGKWADATTAVNDSLTLLTSFAPVDPRSPILIQALAQTLNGRGQLEFAQGKAEQAVATWQQATVHYRQLGDRDGIIGSLTNQVQALEALGLYRRACDTAFEALDIASSCEIENAAAMTLAISQVLGALDTSNQAHRQDCQGFAVERLDQSTCVSSVQLLALRSLGQVLRLVGYLPQSQHVLQQTLEQAKLLQAAPEISATLLSLANTERALYAQAKDLADRTGLRNAGRGAQRQQDKTVDLAHQALAHYQEAIAAAAVLPNRALQIQAQLPLLSLLIDLQQWLNPESHSELSATEGLQPQIQAQLNALTESLTDLPADRTAVYVRVGLAQSLMRLHSIRANSPWFTSQIEGDRIAVVPLLTVALQQAKTLQDKRAESYVLGTLGHWYEQAATQAEQVRAQQLTQSALGLAQATQAWEIAYQWQWQLGRIYTQQRQPELAIAHYTAALETLKSVRADLRAIDAEVQFSFRDAVEPVYRELVELRLSAGNAAQKPLTQNDLRQIVREIDALQVSELENFLRCNLTQPIELDATQIDPTAAVIYPILLDNQMAIVLRLPQPENQPENPLETQSLYLHSVPLPRSTIEPVLASLRQELERPYLAAEALAASQQVYDWLIRSFQPTLAAHQIKTLVFVLDGVLRNIPMAALHDGEHFLVEQYAIALMPGLQLIPPTHHQRRPLSALTFGLSETRPNFPPHENFSALANVETEIEMIQAQIPSRTVLNQKFTSSALQELLQKLPVPIVHVATHGQFSSIPEETFILTWDERIDMNQLSTLLQNRSETTSNPIELLILSACKTADGDSRATLGLAGVAVQSGARSTIASLWSIDDLATADLMGQFYREFIGKAEDPAVTKAEALRRAQVALLKTNGYQAPLFWAAYVLVGDWL
ncbi:MAG: CHAT domain-containing protein [Oscillatoriophycideae cyanobacterium NC_groundwater_1537_Pr4_S-0.65um_50_18]|nr:CHAT domain-containing protein [Oscillatoriophycideae cyanobacterium NC_groundwater_1537_Pr4_S-0.65um_50_18]